MHFSEAHMILYQNEKIQSGKYGKQADSDNLCLSAFSLQIGWRPSMPFANFFTLCGVPLARHSNWSSRRKYDAVTYFQILQIYLVRRSHYSKYKEKNRKISR